MLARNFVIKKVVLKLEDDIYLFILFPDEETYASQNRTDPDDSRIIATILRGDFFN